MTHLADGKYCTLDALKLYGLGSIADPNNPSIYNSAVQGTPDDVLLAQCIQRAEMEFDRIAGTQFDQATLTSVMAFTPFVDGNGFLHLFARERVPVTAVTSVEIRDMKGTRAWTPVTWSVGDIILPMVDGLAHPDSGQVAIYPVTAIGGRATGEIFARWTYTGGFSPIPKSLTAMIQRLAWWIYKLREAPLYQVVLPQLGVMQIPLRIPPDIDADIRLWQPIYS